MKPHRLAAPVFLLAALTPLFATDIDGARVLRSVDETRNLVAYDFSASMTMIREDPTEGIEKNVVRQFRRDREDKFVFLFVEPAVKKGQGYLRIDDNLWFYDPESRKFSHSSMKERFGGTDARNSDFGLSTYGEDYEVAAVSEGSLGKYQVYVLDLRAKHDEVTYARKNIWVTRDRYLILKSEDYSETGRLMRTSLYPTYATVGAQFVPSKMIFVDELVKDKKTTISLTDIALAPLPDSLFTKAYIERVNR